ncbi:MAG: DUF3078 domain-containing protein [Salinivirgaceae bacterium]|nr:DUF3078 domain-containing protein [Salinivirgaceae bacterium]
MSLRKLILLLLCLCPMLLSAQRRGARRPVRESWDRELINNYFRQNRPANIIDSAFYEAYRYLNYQLPADTARHNFSDFVKLVDNNRPEIELAWMRAFYDTVRVRNERFEREMTDNRVKWHLRRTLDTMDVSTADSVFSEILDLVSDNSVNYDSLVSITTPYTDTLVKAIRKNLSDIRKMPVLSQIRRLRNDTTTFYLVNLNGDSLLFRLFNGSPRVIRTTIKDLAGNDEPVLIRDIHRNSFRLLINDSPEIVETDDIEKTRQLLLDILSEVRNRQLVRVALQQPEDPKYWRLGGKIAIDATQMALHNWIKGGENTITLLSTVELYANYKRGPHLWENKGVFKYGAIRQGKKSIRTNEDKINITSNYGYRAFKKFYYSAQLEFKSQFGPIYEYNGNVKTRLASRFMAPATLTVGAGLEYKPNEHNSITVSPLTSKNTFVVSDSVSHSRYNVDDDRYVRSETGLYLKWVYTNKFWKNIEVNSVAEFFSNYFHKPQNVDVDWNLEMVFPINYNVRATITTEMIYDDDQEIPVKDDEGKQIGTTKGLQFKELLKLGIIFRF